ncbi:hypothetical protein DU508_13320 [Pedobacter chinensis]|uniref:Trm112 family protein n=1 Tax=Pedobacter chinensis TaxID=2282421 RepID=A0A369PZD9_9SPHI|nr:Trm112 family protein [Pedobacter chinensis]RDC56555.1 hypothetical protein DU508_13320 [Pedobacter chinensis]
MRIETIKKLCCSFDKADLKLTVISKDIQENILEGILLCKECKRVYPIVSGIPIMSPDEYREFRLEQPLLQRLTKDKVSDSFRLISNESENK